MGFNGGGGGQLLNHEHDGTLVADGGPLDFKNITQSSMSAGSLCFSDGAHLQERTIGAASDVLTVAGGVPTWAGAVTFIAEVTLGSANAVIEKNSGLEGFECVVVDFVLREGSGINFVPIITWYENGVEIIANYGFSESVDGAAIAKTNASTEIPIDANTVSNNNCAGRVIIFPHTGSANIISCSYSILSGSSSSAPDAFATVWGQHDGGANRISGIKFTNDGTATPTFSTESHLEIWGIKAI